MDGRTLMRADASVEAVLGATLLVGAATGWLGADDFPAPVGRALVAVTGAILLGAAVYLASGRVGLASLAVANAATAAAALVWAVAASGFSTAGVLIVAVAAAALACLAAAQVATLLRWAPART